MRFFLKEQKQLQFFIILPTPRSMDPKPHFCLPACLPATSWEPSPSPPPHTLAFTDFSCRPVAAAVRSATLIGGADFVRWRRLSSS